MSAALWRRLEGTPAHLQLGRTGYGGGHLPIAAARVLPTADAQGDSFFWQQEFGTSLAATVRASSEYHLLTDGTHLYLRTSARQVVDLLKNARQPMFDICLSDEVRRVRGEIQARKKTAASERVRFLRRRSA